MKRIRLGILALATALCFAGCSTLPKSLQSPTEPVSSAPETSAPAVQKQDFALSYSSEDTLNPYTAKTRVNLDLATLLYSSLTVLDADFVPQMGVASSVEATDATHWTATLRSDAVYADGTTITAADVAASFQLAKSSANYRDSVSNIASAAADGDRVVFTLVSPDPNTAACLTFPILKGGTVTDEAGKAPVGGGLYVYQEGTNATLTANEKSGKSLSIPTIRLQNLSDDDAMLHGLENGTVSFYYSDLSDGQIPRTANASVQVPLNYLVFLGINAGKEGLSNAAVRSALSLAINRTDITQTAFAGRAQAALTPFHPQWKPVVEITGFSAGENVSQAVAQLEQAGYNTKDEGGKALTLELLYPTGNDFRQATVDLIVQQLASAGVTVTPVPLSFSAYTSRLEKGDFDLYLGEIRLTADMNLRPLLTAGGAAAYGVQTGGTAAAAYTDYLYGRQTLEQFVQAFVGDCPYLPLCWRTGLAAYNRSMSGITPMAFDIYYGIESWNTGS